MLLKRLAVISLLIGIMGLVTFVLALFGYIDLKIGGAGLFGLAGWLNLPEND